MGRLSEALTQVGSPEALLEALRAGRVAARYESIHTAIRDGDRYGVGEPLPASIVLPPGKAIPSNWWKWVLPPFEPESDRVAFESDFYRTLAIGVEVERGRRSTRSFLLNALGERGGEGDRSSTIGRVHSNTPRRILTTTDHFLNQGAPRRFAGKILQERERRENTPDRVGIHRWLRNEPSGRGRRNWFLRVNPPFAAIFSHPPAPIFLSRNNREEGCNVYTKQVPQQARRRRALRESRSQNDRALGAGQACRRRRTR